MKKYFTMKIILFLAVILCISCTVLKPPYVIRACEPHVDNSIQFVGYHYVYQDALGRYYQYDAVEHYDVGDTIPLRHK